MGDRRTLRRRSGGVAVVLFWSAGRRAYRAFRAAHGRCAVQVGGTGVLVMVGDDVGVSWSGVTVALGTGVSVG